MRQGIYARSIKRKLDILLSGTALVVLSPVMAVTAWQVRKKLGSPVLFTQLRPGKGEKIFKMYKFRTMTDERDARGNLLPDEQRLTEFGKFLRESSLDELPELFNILKGDMSIVGPRPQAGAGYGIHDQRAETASQSDAKGLTRACSGQWTEQYFLGREAGI